MELIHRLISILCDYLGLSKGGVVTGGAYIQVELKTDSSIYNKYKIISTFINENVSDEIVFLNTI